MSNQLLDLLQSNGKISDSIAKAVDNFVQIWNCSPYEALLEISIFSPAELADIIASQYKMDRIYNVFILHIEDEVLKLLTFKTALELSVIPLRYVDDHKSILEVLIADPTREDQIQRLKLETKCELTFAVGAKDDIINTIKGRYSVDKQISMLSIQ